MTIDSTAGNFGIAVSGADVETSDLCIAVLLFGQTNFHLAFVVNFNFIFSIGQRFRAGRYKISHLQQYLSVVRYTYRP
jgi:hypothetical protein